MNPLRFAITPRLALAAALLPLAAPAQTIFIDFGTNSTGTSGWNNVSSTSVMASAASLTDFDSKTASGITYQITDDFGSLSTQTGSSFGDFPTTSTNDFFFGQNTNPGAAITFAGFDTNTFYTFTFVSYRNATGSDDRSTEFTLNGLTTAGVATNSLNNLTTVSITAIRPDENGVIVLDIGKAAANTNSNGYFYLNAMKIEVAQVPEPGSAAALAGLFAVAAVALKRRRGARAITR